MKVDWDFGETIDGIPMAWYTPEGYARMRAQHEEYVESGECARADALLAIYAADPMGFLATTLWSSLT